MKRLFVFFLALILCLSLAACDSDNTAETPSTQESTAPSESTAPETSSKEESSTEESTEPSSELPEEYSIGALSAKTYRDSTGTVWAMAAVEVTNTSDAPLTLGLGTITLSANQETVAVLDSVSAYPEILLPGERGYFYEVKALDFAEPADLDLAFELEYAEPLQSPFDYFSVSNAHLLDSPYGTLTIDGTVCNETQYSASMVCVSALLMGEDDELLGIISTILPSGLNAGEELAFAMESFMLPEELKAADVTEMLLYAYPILTYNG